MEKVSHRCKSVITGPEGFGGRGACYSGTNCQKCNLRNRRKKGKCFCVKRKANIPCRGCEHCIIRVGQYDESKPTMGGGEVLGKN